MREVQLDLLAYKRPKPQRQPTNYLSVTRLLWTAAGRPLTAEAVTVLGALCWWCGLPCPDGLSRPRSVLPPTFPFPLQAAVPRSTVLCAPCGWSLCDTVALPHEIAAERIRTRAVRGGRLVVSVRGQPAQRWVVLELAPDESGVARVGLWTPAARASDEEEWTAAVSSLRDVPKDVGPCRFVEAVDYGDLAPEATEKFRSYHHAATQHPARWWPHTDSHRAQIRDWLTAPPVPPWVLVVGDGKKHHVIQAQLMDALTMDNSACVMYHRGAVITYVPSELARQIAAVEALALAGARDEEITSGDYAPRELPLLLALREHDPHLAPIRGGPALPLVLYLRRKMDELRATQDATP